MITRIGKWIFRLVGISIIVLGIHGVFVAGNRLAAIFASGNNDHTKLFFEIDIPVPVVRDVVEWMTGVGFNGYVFPIVVILVGFGVVAWANSEL